MTLYEIHTKLIVLKIAYFSCPIIQSEVKAVDPHTYFTQLCQDVVSFEVSNQGAVAC